MLRCAVRACALASIILLGAGDARADAVTVFAAASLRDGLDAAVTDFEASAGVDVTVSYAGSSVLARQIEQGAPAHLFISANEAWMDVLAEAGEVQATTRTALLGNTLVLVASGEPEDDGHAGVLTAKAIASAVGDERIAMALVEAVPAGIYGRQALTNLGLWSRLAEQVVQSDNVRTALALVERGEAPFGVVYASDARLGRVRTVGTFPPSSHDPIVYSMAIVAGRDGGAVRALYDHLTTPDAWRHFAAAGFTRP
ncbi:molybdate ABC transporter substrate-binding protein [Acuticoccus sp.]|uniref:molybdate ABC transporter substrate-binding protein n=1 Tax=Acuticoccus sp. TaxID=1904378 RepID=UPI003B52BA51